MTTLITDTLTSYAGALVIILIAVVGIGLAYLVFRNAWALLKGVSMPDVRNAWLDHVFYKPWKGYNRFRSRKWNSDRLSLRGQKLSSNFMVAFKQRRALDSEGIFD